MAENQPPIPNFNELLEERDKSQLSDTDEAGIPDVARRRRLLGDMGFQEGRLENLLRPAAGPAVPRGSGSSSTTSASLASSGNAEDVIALSERLEGVALNEQDLEDLQCRSLFSLPERPGHERSGSHSQTGYPFSGNDSTTYFSSLPNASEAVNNADGPLRQGTQPTHGPCNIRGFMVMDLRLEPQRGFHAFPPLTTGFNAVSGLSGFAASEIKHAAAELLKCHEDEIVLRPRGSDVVAFAGVKGDNLHVLVTSPYRLTAGCLILDPGQRRFPTVVACQRWLLSQLRIASSSAQICLLRNRRRMDQDGPQAPVELDDFDDLELALVETFTSRFILRLSQYAEVTFFIEVNNTDYVREVKGKVVEVMRRERMAERLAPMAGGMTPQIWLTVGSRALEDDDLVRNVFFPHVREYNHDSLTGQEDAGDLWTDHSFLVHVQPAGAVMVKINFRSENRGYPKQTTESIAIITPSASSEMLRQEIAKIIHKDASSFKMFISGKKIEQATDLRPLLCGQNVVVVVEQRPKILLRVDEKSAAAPVPALPLTVFLHRYERVQKLREEVCGCLAVPPYAVDLAFQERPLHDLQDLKTCRLRHGDLVLAAVRPHRVRLRVMVRGLSKQWQTLVVDDYTTTTVQQLKDFVRFYLLDQRQVGGGQAMPAIPPSRQPCPCNLQTFNLIFKGSLLQDSFTLKDAGVAMNARLLLVEEEQLCYTAVTPGKFPVFLVGEQGSTIRVMVMTDGQTIYHAFQEIPDFHSPQSPVGEPLELPLLFPANVPFNLGGISLCDQQLGDQFPPLQVQPGPFGGEQPAVDRGDDGDSFVCRLCKSVSTPNFLTSTPMSRPGLGHSQSSTFHDRLKGQRRGESPRENAEPFGHGAGSTSSALGVSGAGGDEVDGPITDRTAQGQSNPSLSQDVARSGGQGLSGSHTRDSLCLERRGPPLTPLVQQPQASPANRPREKAGKSTPEVILTKSGFQFDRGRGSLSPPDASYPPDTPYTHDTPYTPDTSHLSPSAFALDMVSNPLPPRERSHRPQVPDQRLQTPAQSTLPMLSRKGHRGSSQSEKSYRTQTYKYQLSVECCPDGTRKKIVHTTEHETLSPEMANIMAASASFNRNLAGPSWELTQQPTNNLMADSTYLTLPDSTFKYVSKEVIIYVCNNLGVDEESSVLRQLVPNRVFNDASQYKMFDRRYHCLTKWLQINGDKATITELAKVLKANHRNDMAEAVNDLEVRHSGYYTAP